MYMIPRGEFAPKRGRPPLYPIGILKIGESLFFPGVTAHKLRNVFRHHQQMEFERQNVTRDGLQGLLVTRVAERDPDRRRGPFPKYPLRRMNVGDSIFCPGEKASQMWHRWKSINEMKFKARTVIKGGVIGAKVWRIA
jgi:hypothetical protein